MNRKFFITQAIAYVTELGQAFFCKRSINMIFGKLIMINPIIFVAIIRLIHHMILRNK